MMLFSALYSVVIDVSGRQGSVSVTERGHSATVTTCRILRETVCQAIFLSMFSF